MRTLQQQLDHTDRYQSITYKSDAPLRKMVIRTFASVDASLKKPR